MKSCPCGSTGPFYRNRTRPDGLSFYCKACTARQRREEYARKYPNGKGKRGAPLGNKNRMTHGEYSNGRKNRWVPHLQATYNRKPRVKSLLRVPTSGRKEYDTSHLDRLIRVPFAQNEKAPRG